MELIAIGDDIKEDNIYETISKDDMEIYEM
jgi:hypothetical protein